MPLTDTFPPPPPLPQRIPVQLSTTIPSRYGVPSARHLIPSSTPLQPPVPPPTALSEVMAPSDLARLGYERYTAPLFHCHCTPKCIDFVKPRDHSELKQIESLYDKPLRTRVVASMSGVGERGRDGEDGESTNDAASARQIGGRPAAAVSSSSSSSSSSSKHHPKLSDFDVDSRVAYEFNTAGFYSELLTHLDTTYNQLAYVNIRSQAFLHRVRQRMPQDYSPDRPRTYVPYYPTQHAGREGSHVEHAPLKDARMIAEEIQAPIILPSTNTTRRNTMRRSDEDEDAATAAPADPYHRPADQRTSYTFSASSHSHSHSFGPTREKSDPTGARASLKLDREKFAQEMLQKLQEKMTIGSARSSIKE